MTELREDTSPSYAIACQVFLRLLGLVYLIAFVSAWWQVDGLVGPRGILPAQEFLDRVRESLGASAYWRVPTLCWIGGGGLFVHVLCGAGVASAVMLIGRVAPLPAAVVAWSAYLSVVMVGQRFLSFQWDTLLLETGLAAMFVAPVAWRPRAPWRERSPRRVGVWLLWALLFKLMFLSGIVKLLSLDSTWWELTALDYHYFTQPLPTWTSWYAHHLPGWFQQASVVGMFVIELGVPFLIFVGRRSRIVAFAALVFLQVTIAGTGNYGFFNLLTVVLCVPLVDDRFVRWILPFRFGSQVAGDGGGKLGRRIVAGLAGVVLVLSTLTFVREMVRTTARRDAGGVVGTVLRVADERVLSWAQPWVLRWTDPFRSVNGYGLFRSMTTARPEIAIEGSADGLTWREYGFRWKAGDPARRPRFVAPHMPRLDWQMWFAALSPQRARPWLERLILRLLEGEPEVLALLADNPFPDAPPRYIRLTMYRYEFTTDASSKDWWTRERVGQLTAPITRDQFQPLKELEDKGDIPL